MRPLALGALDVRGFRNLNRVEIELGEGFNVFSGQNGQGKTSLLEAVYVLATSRSFRTGKLTELISLQGETASVRGVLHDGGSTREQSVGLRRGLRSVRVDAKRPPTLAAYALHSPIVVFHPGALALSMGSGNERRRLLDRIAMHFSPASWVEAESYSKAHRARQRVLELRGEHSPELSDWEELMARHGGALREARAAAAERLAVAGAEAFARIGPGTSLLLRYQAGSPSSPSAFRAELARLRGRDRARGSASVGPHRDNLATELGGRPVRGIASQGQHRAVVLALELAEMDVIASVRGVRPILLLDDVSSELDRERATSLFAALGDLRGQVLVTTTRPDILDIGAGGGAAPRRDFDVSGGAVVPA